MYGVGVEPPGVLQSRLMGQMPVRAKEVEDHLEVVREDLKVLNRRVNALEKQK